MARAKYEIGGNAIRRKNLYMPCVIGARVETMSDEEHAAILNATYWADNVTNSEWPALLRHEGFSASARSRLKKKAAGWIIVLGRIAVLNPELFAEIVERATTTYEEHTETEYPAAAVAGAITSLQTFRNWQEGAPGTLIQVWAEVTEADE